MHRQELTIVKMRQNAIESDKDRDALREEIKRLSTQNALEREDKEFYHKSAMESKK